APLVNNYLTFIYNSQLLKSAPASWQDLLDSRYKNKLQYSTPGQAGDGTAVMLQAFHSLGGKDAGFAYLGKLQANNVGPSASTGKLTALVNNAGILFTQCTVESLSAERINRVLATNVTGYFLCCREAVKR
ncbi:SDR family NAD(P)-dependent oxidoreductase, partial [Escherichia coli]|nr:SDR family NAD(P)-dependent oxidoreductase [Escherichia coli]